MCILHYSCVHIPYIVVNIYIQRNSLLTITIFSNYIFAVNIAIFCLIHSNFTESATDSLEINGASDFLPRRCGGCEASAVYVDIDGRFNVLRFTALIDCFKMVTSEGFLVDIQIESYAYKFDAEITYSYA